MKKGVNSFFVSFIALILATPIAGVTSTFAFSDSYLLSNEMGHFSRSSYEVDIDFAGENTGYQSITRNELVTFAFVVSNLGTMDDTYDLEISWEDDGAGWSGESEYETVSVPAAASTCLLCATSVNAPKPALTPIVVWSFDALSSL